MAEHAQETADRHFFPDEDCYRCLIDHDVGFPDETNYTLSVKWWDDYEECTVKVGYMYPTMNDMISNLSEVMAHISSFWNDLDRESIPNGGPLFTVKMKAEGLYAHIFSHAAPWNDATRTIDIPGFEAFVKSELEKDKESMNRRGYE